MTAADDKFCDIFLNFKKKKGMIFHENRLPAKSYLICCFQKGGKTLNCHLLQILGGALRVNAFMFQLKDKIIMAHLHSNIILIWNNEYNK